MTKVCKKWGHCRRERAEERSKSWPSVQWRSLHNDPIDVVRWELLFTVFDGNPEKWHQYLEHQGSVEQRRVDLPFVLWLRRALDRDPDFLGSMVAYAAEETPAAC